jgi:uncharacterized protein YdhG (YjbR/CyaY superfamily)
MSQSGKMAYDKTRGIMNPIETYIQSCPPDVQDRLKELRRVILEEAPMAIERMAYGMPTFTVDTNLVHFAAQSQHIGFYPGSSGVEAFEDQLGDYDHSKGTIRFPLNQPIPYDLVRQIVRYRLAENEANRLAKLAKRGKKPTGEHS